MAFSEALKRSAAWNNLSPASDELLTRNSSATVAKNQKGQAKNTGSAMFFKWWLANDSAMLVQVLNPGLFCHSLQAAIMPRTFLPVRTVKSMSC
jgi:hypothetical protein